jgi:anti-anti-sigma factor
MFRLRLSGEFDIANLDRLRAIVDAVGDRAGPVYIDVGDLAFIDVAGLTVLADFATDRRPHPVVLQRPSPLLRRVLGEIWVDSGLELE